MMEISPPLTLIICTYNRAEFVHSCLESLLSQSLPPDQFKVLVVDNNSSDDTAAVAQAFYPRLPGLRVVHEPNQGLSHARNRGFREADTDWVVYLDDDALAAPNFVERALHLIQHTNYRIFGGVFLPWYKYGRPRWYRDAYGSNRLPYTHTVTLTGDHYACGGIMAIQRSLLQTYGGFHTGIGMAGGKLGYAEETELQQRMRRDGIAIGYDPHWIIQHVVAPYKLSVGWFFRAAFALGRDKVHSGMTSSRPAALVFIALTALAQSLFDATRFGLRWAFQRDYYVENWLIDSFRKAAKRTGMIYTALLIRYGSND